MNRKTLNTRLDTMINTTLVSQREFLLRGKRTKARIDSVEEAKNTIAGVDSALVGVISTSDRDDIIKQILKVQFGNGK